MIRLAIALLFMIMPATAFGQSRQALLIGNQGYTNKVGVLKNPHQDIAVIAKSLEAIGFTVQVMREVRRRPLLGSVKAYAERLAAAGSGAIGFFYYSGHGVSSPVDHANYLIPVDLQDTDSQDFWYDAVKLDDLLAELERVAPLAAHFIVFDACRNELKLPGKTIVKGFEPVAQRSGMFITYATALGSVASDGGEYARVMAAELLKPGQDHLQLFQNVREGVFASTKKQVPWDSNGLLRRIYFSGELTRPTPSTPQRPTTQELAAQRWELIKDVSDIAVLEAFRKQFANADPVLDSLAKKRIEELKQQAILKEKAEQEEKRRQAAEDAARKAREEREKREAREEEVKRKIREAAERAPALWDHNGSIVKLLAEMEQRRFFYENPRDGMREEGVTEGTLLFDGVRNGNTYSGNAYVFLRGCGSRSYRVSGTVSDSERVVKMHGQAPRMDSSCQITGYRSDELVFVAR